MTDTQQEKNSRLLQVRKALKLTQLEMAELLGIDRGNLSNIEKGKEGRNVPKDAKFILEREKNINPDWFETGEGEMFKKKSITDEPRFMKVPGFTELLSPKGYKEKLNSEEFKVEEEQVRAMYSDLKTKLMMSYEENIELLREVSSLKDTIIHLKDKIFELSK